jgi:pyruvate formate lyase activating enzyme
MLGLIFNIQRYSIHDGGGIRTLIFFKGCPLRCPWCCNPESQSFEKEFIKLTSQCIHCGACAKKLLDCPAGALLEQGRYMTVEEVLDEVLKDEIFYHTSQGGVTLSGGEVLAQGDFAKELLKRLKDLGIHTAIETSGAGEWGILAGIAEYSDLILYDLKIMNSKASREIIGIASSIIKEHFTKLVSMGFYVIPRVPLIPGHTMEEKNMDAVIDFVKQNGVQEIHLLPFHQYGSSKYESLGRTYTLIDMKTPTDEEITAIEKKMVKAGLKVVIGGM